MDRIRLLRSTNHVQYSPLNVKPEHSALSPSVSSGINMMDDDLEFIPSKKSKRSLCSCLFNCCRRYFQTGKQLKPRTVWIGKLKKAEHYPPNKICNQKYNILTFIPGVLYNQFKFFLNLYFLLMACSQFIPQLKIGYLYTYWAPLGFVLTVTLLREGWDEVKCYRRDKEINSAKYKRIDDSGGTRSIPSSDIKVSDVIMVEKDQRVPADLVLLQTTEKNGTCFIRTDQLDGETDWKLRIAVTHTQAVTSHAQLFTHDAHVYAEKPRNDIHSFVGTFSMSGTDSDEDQQYVEESLNVENSLWANTVVASGCAVGVVVYTGRHTRSSMNTSNPSTKIGLLDMEINFLTKILFTAVIVLSFFLIAVKGFDGPWYQYMFRFVILFSYIIPISLRVNLDMGKTVYNWLIQHDANIPDTIVRTSTIPEELGRINYLLSDKTGTLTQNDMIFKRLHMGTVSYGCETMDEVESHLKQAFVTSEKRAGDEQVGGLRLGGSTQQRRKEQVRIKRSAHEKTAIAVKALAICHNVTPVYESKAVTSPAQRDDADDVTTTTDETSFSSTDKTYQASSPDEVALVKWTETVGLSLDQRDLDMMQLRTPHGELLHFDILQVFPFTSESKRMGIIVRERATQQIVFYVKGADAVMTSIVQFNDWLGEECDNMAREGLRTLVVARKLMADDVYADFERRYTQAKLSVTDRAVRVAAVVETLERDMELLCLTGVEDKLQLNVKPTLEMLSNAGIKIWMLTGDKLETTICIAKSARLVSRDQSIHVFQEVSNRTESHLELNAFRRRASDTALIIRGSSLAACLRYYATELVELACQCPAVLVCRCSPTQKAQIVSLLRQHTGKRVCAIGDGGNDVSMIQAADCGIGIVGKEGKQASLAADFSLTQFCHLGPLLMVHGRNSYKRSAALSQFIIHRGLIISVMQAIFSSVFYFSSVSLYQGYLMVGYTTIFTMFPVFSLVLDQDVKEEVALRFPELYRELHKGRSLSLKTFLLWVLISIYQGGAIMYGALLLFDSDFTHIVSISFTALILTELVMVALTIRTWHWAMLLSEAGSLAIYALALFLLKDYFDETFLTSSAFLWRVVVITCATCLPLALLKYVRRRFSPPSYSKLEE